MEITFKSSKMIKLLSLTAIILIAIHITILGVQFYTSIPVKFQFMRMFNLDMEANLPTSFSFVILLFSAFLFYLLSKMPEEKNENRPFWLGLSFVFLFLAFDESSKIHEAIGDLTDIFIHTSNGYLSYPWVISYTALVLVLGVFYIRFFWRMKRKVFFSFIVAAVLYLSGALGFEILGAKEASLHGADTVLYAIYSTVEESLEIFGVIFLIKILLDLLNESIVKIYFHR